jgi:hypothetical protein
MTLMPSLDLEELLTDFFSDAKIIERLSKIFKKVCNYECFHPRPLHDYWFKQITEEDKYLKGLHKHDSETLYKIMEDLYYKKIEENNKKEEEKTKLENEETNKKNKKYKISKEKYEKLKEKFSELSKPKDKWRTGRAMINLRKQFKYDNIVNKMIKYEFQNNKVFKFPEE